MNNLQIDLEQPRSKEVDEIQQEETNVSKSSIGATSNMGRPKSIEFKKSGDSLVSDSNLLQPKSVWKGFVDLIFHGKEKEVDANFQKKRSLGKPYATVIHQWGMGVGMVILGEYIGWNFGLTYGWGSMIVAVLFAVYVYWALILCLAEMTAALPFTGGPSLFATAAFGPLAGTIIGYSYVFEFFLAGSSDLVSTGIVLQEFIGCDASLSPLLWFFLIVFFTLTNLNKQLSYRISLILTMISFVVIFIFLFAIIPKLMPSFSSLYVNSNYNSTSPSSELFFPQGFSGVLSSLPFAFWFFLGIEIMPLCAEETIHPETTSPRGLISSMISLTFIAGLTFLIFPMAPPGAIVLSNSSQPYVDTLVASYNITSVPAIKIIQFLNMFGYLVGLHTVVYSYSRHVYALSRGGHLPVWLSITNPKTGGPVRATVFGSCVVFIFCLISWFSQLDFINMFLLNGAVMFALLSYTGEFLAFISLRYKMKTLIRPYRNPLGIPGAIIGACLTVTTFVSCMYYLDMFRLAGIVCLVMVVAIIPYYLIFARKWLLLTPEKVFVQANLKQKSAQRLNKSAHHSSSGKPKRKEEKK